MNIPVSYKTLSRYLDGIPDPKKLSDIFLQYICEVEGTEMHGDDTVYEIKVTPDRGDLLSYWGIAREVAVYSGAKIKDVTPKIINAVPTTQLSVVVDEPKLCPRYIGRVVEGVDDRQSPAWLRDALEASGQRSINAIVDVTNFVMLETGQPMHAFDTAKLSHEENDGITIHVRKVNPGEKIETLDGKDIALPENTLVIADSVRPLAIAGVKGGAYAGVGDETSTIVLEAAVFNPVAVRKTSRAVGITTDSSRRFEHHRSPEITRVAMDRAIELLLEIFPEARAGEVVDVYPRPASPYRVGLSPKDIERLLGVSYSASDLSRDLDRLNFSYERIQDGADRIVSRAQELVGVPYVYGASVLFDAPRKFDCSGFVSYLFLGAGVRIPRMTVDQYVFGEEVSTNDMQPGDLIFSVGEKTGSEYHESKEWLAGTKVPKSGIDHVGLYLGNGMVIHSSRHNKDAGHDGGIAIEELSESPRFKTIVGVRRIKELAEERFLITVPAGRFDLRVGADIAEEVVRLMGYDKVPTIPLKNTGFEPSKNGIYNATLLAHNALLPLGFSEIFTYVFRREGKVEVANPMAEGISFLRDNLTHGMKDALVFNARNAPLVGVDEVVMFEIGTVFLGIEKEELHISLGATVTKSIKQSKKEARENEILSFADKALSRALSDKLSWHKEGNVWECVLPAHVGEGDAYEPLIASQVNAPYRAISSYPFMLRDIALWSNGKLSQDQILEIIRTEAGPLLVRDRLFDVFTKDFDGESKTSYAFNLVFQSYERTLSDVEINEVMARITEKLSAQGLEVR